MQILRTIIIEDDSLNKLLIETGLSYRKLSELVGIDHVHLYRIFSGKIAVKQSTYNRLQQFFESYKTRS